MSKRCLALAAVCAATSAALGGEAESSSAAAVEAELQAISRELMDAIASGNREVWEHHLAPQVAYVDADGSVKDRATVLAELRGLPPGFKGTIEVVEPSVTISGDTAILTYRALETEQVFDQEVGAVYRVSDVYVRRDGRWLLFGSQGTIVPPAPARIRVAAIRLDEYAGTFVLGPGQEMTVARDGERLMARRNGSEPYELAPSGPDTFFVPGGRGDRMFARDERGRVVAFVDRRDGRDLRWTRRPRSAI